MKRALETKLSAGLVLCFGLLVSAIGSSTPLQNPPQNPTEKSATLIVKVKQGLSEAARQVTVRKHGGTRKHSFTQLDLEVVEMPEGKVAAFIKNAKDDPDLVRVEVNHTRKLQSLPSDTLIAEQWALPKIGWDQVYGNIVPSSTAEVAILDTGIDPTHPDLVGAIGPGVSMIDESAGLTDPNGHGTWLAGIVAGRTDNAVGIAGVAYSQVRVQPVKVLDANGEGQDSDIINGVLWATDHGASVILMAFSDPGFSPALQEAIDYAWSRGVVLVAAAGNDASNVATFPAGDKGVIGVSATDANDELSVTSNYGPSVFLAAPGVNIESTYLDTRYVTWSGTSASAAIVAGSAALMRAVDPTLTNGVVVNRIATTADPAGTPEQTGNGRINLARAIVDTGTDEIVPGGAGPGGNAGPFVGPYKSAAGTRTTSTNINCGTGSVAIGTARSCTVTVADTQNGNKSFPTGTFNVTASGAGVSPVSASCVLSGSGNGPSTCTVGFTGGSAGTITVVANYGGDANHAVSSGSAAIVVVRSSTTGVSCVTPVLAGQASSCTVTVTDGNPGPSTPSGTFNVTASGAGVSPTSTSCILSGNGNHSACTVNFTGAAAGMITVSASYPGDAAHAGSSGVDLITVNSQVASSLVASAATGTYGGTVNLTATLACSAGINGKTINFTVNGGSAGSASTNSSGVATLLNVSLSGINAGTYGAGVGASFTADSVCLSSTDTDSLTVNKANAIIVVTPYQLNYNGVAHTATGTATGVGGANLNAQLTLTATTHTNAGDYPADAWSFAGGTNYNNANGTVHDSIGKANAVIVVTPYHVAYDANAHMATGTASGIAGVDLSASLTLTATTHTNAGDYPADVWSFAGGINYNDANGTTHDVIDKANAALNVTGFTGVYDATSHGASATITGVTGDSLAAGSSFNRGSTFTNVPGGFANWTFTGGSNYNDQNGTVEIVISKATASVTVTGYHVSYDGNAHTATGTATGAGGADLSANLILSATAHTNSGNYSSDGWSFAGGTNYNDASGTVHDIIDRSNATIVVTPYNVNYDGLTHTATGTANGVQGETLSGLDLTGTSHTNAGSYPADSWTFTDVTGNYFNAGGTTSDSIAKIHATITVNGFNGPYDASAHGASGTATGAGGENLNSQLLLGATFTNGPGGNAHWVFAGGTNYLDESGDVAILIHKIPASINVIAYDGLYDGALHGASGTATGLGGINLGDLLHVGSATFMNVPGGTVAWNFDGDSNYNLDSGSVDVKIGKTHATINIQGFNGSYDGAAHEVIASVSGAVGEDLIGQLNAGASFTNVPGGTAHWVFTGGINYVDESGDEAIVITRALSTTTTLGDGPFTFDATSHTGGSGTVTGAGGLSTTATSLTYSGDQVNSGTYYVTAHYSGDANHEASDGAAIGIVIDRAASTTVTSGAGPFTYDGSTHTGGSGTVTGAGGLSIPATSLTYSGDQVNSGTYYVTAHYSGDANHEASDGAAIGIVIDRAASTTVTSGAGPFTYDGSTQTGGSGAVTGAGGLSTIATSLTYTGDQINAGSYTVTAHYAGDANHTPSDGAAVAIVINKAASTTTTIGGGPFTYDGSTHAGGSGSVTGAGGLSTNATSLTYSGDQVNAGSYDVTAHYTGDANHEASHGAAMVILINKATATINVAPYHVTYDGAAHTATASATGVGGVDLSAGLNLDGTTHTTAGPYVDSWSFTGGANYSDATGTVSDIIAKANAVVTVNGYSGMYDGNLHGASGSAHGIGGANMNAALNLGGSFKEVPGGTAHWVFAGGTNYNDQTGDVAIIINKWTVSGFYQPVDMTPAGSPIVWNTVKGGSTVPLKFNIYVGTTEQTSINAIKEIQIFDVTCSTSAIADVPLELTTTGGTSLRYDTTAHQFIQNWQTPKAAGKCYAARMTAQDGSTISNTFFKTK